MFSWLAKLLGVHRDDTAVSPHEIRLQGNGHLYSPVDSPLIRDLQTELLRRGAIQPDEPQSEGVSQQDIDELVGFLQEANLTARSEQEFNPDIYQPEVERSVSRMESEELSTMQDMFEADFLRESADYSDAGYASTYDGEQDTDDKTGLRKPRGL